jgi:hypothetical protein
VAALVVTIGLAMVGAATADPGQSQTFHFDALVEQLGAPTGPTTNVSNCPAPVVNDFTDINATGNGVTHFTVNGAGDFWFTSTFTGDATVTYYPSGTFDQNGNVTSVGGTPALQVTGHLTEWDGFSGNAQNAVGDGTVNFEGTVVGSGVPISFHDVTHFAWLPGVDQNGPPSFFFNVASC